MTLTDDESDQVRDLLDIEDVWGEFGYVGPAEVHLMTRNGRPWGAAHVNGAWMSTHDLVRGLVTPASSSVNADTLIEEMRGCSPTTFRIMERTHRSVLVDWVWFNSRYLAGMIALHGPPTHSVSCRGGTALVWKQSGHPRAALMSMREPYPGRDFLADLHMEWTDGGAL